MVCVGYKLMFCLPTRGWYYWISYIWSKSLPRMQEGFQTFGLLALKCIYVFNKRVGDCTKSLTIQICVVFYTSRTACPKLFRHHSNNFEQCFVNLHKMTGMCAQQIQHFFISYQARYGPYLCNWFPNAPQLSNNGRNYVCPVLLHMGKTVHNTFIAFLYMLSTSCKTHCTVLSIATISETNVFNGV